MSNDVKSRMKGFITEARTMKKEAKVVEDQAKEVKDKLKGLEEQVLIAQINQKNIDLEFDKVQNEYYAAVSKKELLQQKLVAADATQRAQAVKIASFGSEAEECLKKAEEAEKKYNEQVERMASLRKGLKDAHALSVLADKEVNLKQMEIDDAKRQQHESLQRLREAQNELDKNEGDIVKYNKIGELWEAKCEQLEEELMNTKNAVKQVRGLNEDSFEVTEELKEEIMFLQMSIRRHEQRAEFAEGIVDKLEHQCEGLNDQLFLENGKFMEMSNKLENGGSSSNTQNQQQQPTVQQDRLLAPSKMELPMSPAAQAITPTNEEDQFILEESEVPCETEELAEEEQDNAEKQQQQQQFQSDIEQVEYNNHLGLVDGDTSEAVE